MAMFPTTVHASVLLQVVQCFFRDKVGDERVTSSTGTSGDNRLETECTASGQLWVSNLVKIDLEYKGHAMATLLGLSTLLQFADDVNGESRRRNFESYGGR